MGSLHIAVHFGFSTTSIHVVIFVLQACASANPGGTPPESVPPTEDLEVVEKAESADVSEFTEVLSISEVMISRGMPVCATRKALVWFQIIKKA